MDLDVGWGMTQAQVVCHDLAADMLSCSIVLCPTTVTAGVELGPSPKLNSSMGLGPQDVRGEPLFFFFLFLVPLVLRLAAITIWGRWLT